MTKDISIFTEEGFATTFKISEAMVKSGILPRGIDNPYKAFAIIQKGREMGVEPMRALTGIYLIEGKTVVSPELKLECFRARGGKVQWLDSSEKLAHVKLTSPDGTEHEERVTIAEMAAAGLTGKDNWRKYPKSMLRARCIAFALRAMGEGDGSYTPDELGAETTEAGEYIPPPVRESASRIAGTHGEAAKAEAPKAAVRAAETRSGSIGECTFPTDSPCCFQTRKWPSHATLTSMPTWREAPGENRRWHGSPAAQASRVAVRPLAELAAQSRPTRSRRSITLQARKVGGTSTDQRSISREGVGGLPRKMDGSMPCAANAEGKGTSKLLSKDQASHLIQRFEDKIATSRSSERELEPAWMRSTLEGNGRAKHGNVRCRSCWIIGIQKAFTTAEEQASWLRRHSWAVDHSQRT